MSDKDDDQKFYSFKDGMPTGPDVEMLLKQWPDLNAGDRVPYEDVEALLGLERESTRFKTVTNKWRDRLHEKGLVTECIIGKAFLVLVTEQIIANTPKATLEAQRKLRKQRKALATIRPADEMTKAIVQHQGQLLNARERDLKKTRMNLLPSTKVPERPRIEPPQEAVRKQN